MLALGWPLRPRHTRRWIKLRSGLLLAFTSKRIMRSHPFLNPIEAFLVRWLSRSPRIGMVVIKEHGSLVSWVIHDQTDPMIEDPEDFPEPPSMQLERLYHAPDAQR